MTDICYYCDREATGKCYRCKKPLCDTHSSKERHIFNRETVCPECKK